MTAEQFVYWLQGFMEINDPDTISKSETRVIKDHLALVFDKQTPTTPGFNPNQTPPFFPNTTTPLTSPYDAPWIPKVVCETTTPTPPAPIDINSINPADLVLPDQSPFNFVTSETSSPGLDLVNKING